MKINNNTYQCEWCMESFTYLKQKSSAQKGHIGSKGAVSNALHCSKCRRLISQK